MGSKGKVSQNGVVFCLVGPSAGGKTTLSLRLLEHFSDSMQLSISATTRPPRSPGEKEAGRYLFMSLEEFMAKVAGNSFFEWEEIHGNLYGTLRSTVEKVLEKGVDLLLDIDIQGAINFKKQLPTQTVLIFLVPPSTKVLLERIRKRSNVTEEEIARRLNTARKEYAQFEESFEQEGLVDYFVVNDDLECSTENLFAIVRAERCRLSRLHLAEVRRICTISWEAS